MRPQDPQALPQALTLRGLLRGVVIVAAVVVVWSDGGGGGSGVVIVPSRGRDLTRGEEQRDHQSNDGKYNENETTLSDLVHDAADPSRSPTDRELDNFVTGV